MRDLELQDAVEQQAREAQKHIHDIVAQSEREVSDTIAKARRSKVNSFANASDNVTSSTRDFASSSVYTRDTSRSSNGERYSQGDERQSQDISGKPWRERLTSDERAYATPTTSYVSSGSWRDWASKDTSAESSTTSQSKQQLDSSKEHVAGSYRRGSWRERLGMADTTSVHTYVNADGSASAFTQVRTCEGTSDHVVGSYIHRLGQERTSDDNINILSSVNINQTINIKDESPTQHVAGSYRRGSWRERLGRENVQEHSATDTNRYSQVKSPTEHVPGTYRRGSWKERLGRDTDQDNSSITTASFKQDEPAANHMSGSYRRGSWRERDTEEENSASHTDRVRQNKAPTEHVPGSYRRGSWREQLGRDTEQATSVCTTDGVRKDEAPTEHVPGSYRRWSWRERLGRDTEQETSASTTDRVRQDEAPTEHVPGSYRRGSWRERLNREESTQETSSRPWRERLARADYTQHETEDTGTTDLARSRQSTEDTDQVGLEGSWSNRLHREDSEQMAPRNISNQANHTQESHSAENGNISADHVQRENSTGDIANVENGDNEVDENNDSVFHEENNDHTNTETERTEGVVEGEKKEGRSWSVDDVLKLLIKAINYRTPLKDLETILRWQFDVNTPYKNGLRALHYAAYTNYVECVELLLNKGANINITDDIGYTPLHLAARCGYYKTMEKLIENGAMLTFNEPGVEIRGMDDTNKLGFTNAEPVNLAIQNYHPECAELLLKHGARADNKYFMGYEISLAPLDDIRGIAVLLKYGASPNVFNRCGQSPLMKACKDHRIDAVRLLLQNGADYNAQSPPMFEQKSVLQVAIESGNIVIVNLLLFKNPKLTRNDNYNYSALHTAVMKGRADICRLLLQKGADPEERTEAGATPLMIACSHEGIRERKEIVQMLLDCGAEINSYGENFSYFDPYLSPIAEYFKKIGNSESFNIIDILISNGARIHFTTGDVLLGGRRDPFAILPYAHTMIDCPEVFEKTMQAAQRFNPLSIHACDSLPEEMKNTLLLVATQPADLKQIVRLALRQIMMPDLYDNVMELPLPELIKNYLLFK